MSYYMEVNLEDMTFDEGLQMYFYPCPCGDKFQLSVDELLDGEETARFVIAMIGLGF
jgi:diphthamide biosynthesis protein 3